MHSGCTGAGIGGAEVAELAGARVALALLEDRGQAVDQAQRAYLDRRLARSRVPVSSLTRDPA